jgi:hypothetical protein
MAIKRFETTIKRDGGAGIKNFAAAAGGIKRFGGIEKKRPPLAEPEIDDPMQGMKLDPKDRGQQAQATLSAALKSLHQKREAEAKSMELTTDGAFYFVAVFDTRDQKMAFLNGIGYKEGDLYVDGRQMADCINGKMNAVAALIALPQKLAAAFEAMKLKLPMVDVKMPKLFRVDKKYAALALRKGEK